jgi:hypothetical protein
MIDRYLEDLESRIDEETENDLLEQWVAFSEGRTSSDVFLPRRQNLFPSDLEWPAIRVNEALDDYTKMAMQQLRSNSLLLGDRNGGGLLAVRCNYGTGIIPTLFGADLFYMEDKHNTLPTSRPIPGGIDGIRKVIDKGIPDVHQGLGGRVFEMAEYFIDIQQRYPKLGKHVHIYHPDTQGPMDICELMWGSNLFLDIVDTPNVVHEMLELITETYVCFMKEWIARVPLYEGYAIHWHMLHRGHIMLRDDSAMNFSPAMFDEFIRPYDQRLLTEFGGGALHFCGRGDHYIRSASEMEGFYAVNMSQPSYNDMEVIYRNTVDKGIKLIGLPKVAADEALGRNRPLHSNVHCT